MLRLKKLREQERLSQESLALKLNVSDVYKRQLMNLVASGFGAILVDGVPFAVLGGLQNFMIRSVSEPSSEVTMRGSREGFTEAIRVNISTVSYTHLTALVSVLPSAFLT